MKFLFATVRAAVVAAAAVVTTALPQADYCPVCSVYRVLCVVWLACQLCVCVMLCGDYSDPHFTSNYN